MNRPIIGLLLLTFAAPAAAQDLRDLCADRPGLGVPACTVDKGHVQIEIGLADWTRDSQPDSRTDTILVGDSLARIGVGDATELRLGWTAYGHESDRDRATGLVDRAARVGDVTVGLKQNLVNPDGDKLSIALLPFASLPVGRQPIGAGTWSAGLIVPVDYALNKALTVQFTPEIDASANESGHGRHLAYGGVVGLGIDLSDSVSTEIEIEESRDRDPSGHTTQSLAGVSLAFQPTKQTQLDIGVNAGLNHNSPDAELYVGVSRKF
jgi:hypothetical protein